MGLKGAIIPGSKLDQIINKSKGTMNDAPPIKAPSHTELAQNFADNAIQDFNAGELKEMYFIVKDKFVSHIKKEHDLILGKREGLKMALDEIKGNK